jgi:hypothetical protein
MVRDILKKQNDGEAIKNLQVIDLLNPGTARKPLAVRWSKKLRGFFVENLFTVDCEELDDLLAVLEEGELLPEVFSYTLHFLIPHVLAIRL